MTDKNNLEHIKYVQISEDWRHRDNLTWQLPSIIVIIGGALITAAFGLNIDPQYLYLVRATLLGFGALLSFCLTFALTQNLWYQIGSSEYLKKFVNLENKEELPNLKLLRSISPRDFKISPWYIIIKQHFKGLLGSIILLFSCFVITFWLFGLFFVVIC